MPGLNAKTGLTFSYHTAITVFLLSAKPKDALSRHSSVEIYDPMIVFAGFSSRLTAAAIASLSSPW